MFTRLENFGAGGLNYDLFETGLGASQWSDLINVDVRNGDLFSAGADQLYGSETPCVPLYVFLYEVEGSVVDLVSDGDSLHASVGGGEWVELAAGLGGQPVGFTVFRGCLVVNTGVGPFYWCSFYGQAFADEWDAGRNEPWDTGTEISWLGESAFAGDEWDTGLDEDWDNGSSQGWNAELAGELLPLPGWPAGATALQIVAYKDQLVAIGGTDNNLPSAQPPYLLRWSSLAPAGSLPETWEPQEGNFAGFAMVQDTQGWLSSAALMRDDLILYKTDSIWRLSATGDPTVPMRLERIMTCNGIESPNAVAVCSEVHFLVTKRGFAVFDGNQVRFLDFARVQSDIVEVMVGNAFSTVRIAYFAPEHEVWIAYKQPSDTEFYSGILKYNTQHNSFCHHEYPSSLRLVSLAAGKTSESAQPIDSWVLGDELSWDAGPNTSWDDFTPGATADSIILGFQLDEDESWDIGRDDSWDGGSDTTWVGRGSGAAGSLAKYDLYGDPVFYNSTPKETEAVRYGVRLVENSDLSVIRALYPEMEGDEVSLELGLTWYPSQDKTPGNVKWQPRRFFTPSERRKVPLRVVGDSFALRVRGQGGSWRLHAVGVDYDLAGRC